MQVNKTNYGDWILSGLGVVFMGGALVVLAKELKTIKNFSSMRMLIGSI